MPLTITGKSPRLLATPSPQARSTPKLPTFYPPSYYAAASGISYSQIRQAEHKDKKSPLPSDELIDNTSHYEQFMPMSYPPNPLSSESSFESKPSRFSRQIHSTGHITHTKLLKREKRQSQIAGLPQIEAQLLPSLRDTVDRMTRPPSRTTSSHPVGAKAPHSFNHGLYESGLETHSGCPAREKSYPSEFSSNAHDIHLTPRLRGLPPANAFEDTRSTLAVTPPIKSKYPKSALRTPTQRSFQGEETPRLNAIAGSNARGTSSLRSVKSILRRKLSTSSTTTTPPGVSPKKSILKGTPKPRPSPTPSVTHCSGTMNLPHSNHAEHSPIQSKGTLPRSGTRTPNPPKHFTSNIPRFRARFATAHTNHFSPDSSDLENRCEWERRDRRRLTVINADAPSTSGSDWDSGKPGSTMDSGSRIGLGFDYGFQGAGAEIGACDDQMWSDHSTDKTSRSSIISSSSSDSQYSHSQEPPVYPMATDEYERRRAALLNIVSSLDQSTQRRLTQCSDSSDYQGEQGFAYSGTGDMDVLQSTSHKTTLPVELIDINRTVESHRKRQSQYVSASSSVLTPDGSPGAILHGDKGKQSVGGISTVTARLTRRSLMVATREREAFGLKPSDSEVYHHQYEQILDNPGRDSHFSASSTGDRDSHQMDDLSNGASYMLQSIQVKRVSLEKHEYDPENCFAATPRRSPSVSLSDAVSSEPELGTTNLSPAETDAFEQLRVTERSFVKNLQTCVQHYVLPLRKHGSKTWISGVPPRISRFLDWLEDILHLHEQMLDILHRQQTDVIRQLFLFLPKFEIYQPYVARVASMHEELQLLTEDGSDFGCFVDLQDKQNRDTGWTLRKYILEPEGRLQQYLQIFSALLELTARKSSQYILIFGLLRSMELIIDVMYTVKREEEDHYKSCALLTRFRGPYPLTSLADRTRPILWHGPLILNRGYYSEGGTGIDIPQNISRTRRLSRAITAWDEQQSAPGPNHEISSSQTSFSSYDSQSTYPGSDESSDRSSSDWEPLGAGVTRLHYTAVPVYAIVFSDLMLFGGRASDTSDSYELLSDIGQVRVFSVEASDDASASLEVIPVKSPNCNPADPIPGLERIFISQAENSLLPSLSGQAWQAAFKHSAENTTQIWCRPWKPSQLTGSDTARIVASLVDSGLPLPRSPSSCVPELCSQDDANKQEREERGWWSMRFHQVMCAKRQMPDLTHPGNIRRTGF